MNRHRPTPIQRRVLLAMFRTDTTVAFETGHKTTQILGSLIRCQSTVHYFLRAHGYIHRPNDFMNQWELTPKGIDTATRMSRKDRRS